MNNTNITITTREQFNTALLNLLSSVDFATIGMIKPHMKAPEGSDVKVDTGNVFLTAQLRLPGTQKVTVGDLTAYTKHFAIKFDAFNLMAEPDAETAAVAKAATSNADLLRDKLKIAPKPGDVVAVPAPPVA